MKDGCECMGKPQAQETTLDLDEAVAKGKQERQAVLKRVRRQRAIAMKRLAGKDLGFT
jgi:hypothetical protein